MIDLILNSKDEVSKDEAKSKLHSILDRYCWKGDVKYLLSTNKLTEL